MERLRRRFPHDPGARLRARRRRRGRTRPTPTRLRGRTDLEVATDFVAHVAVRAPTTTSRRCWPDALESVRADEVGGLMRLHSLTVTAFGPFADTEHGRLRRAVRGRSLPPPRADRCRQDQHPRRRLLRALRPGARRAAGSRSLRSDHAAAGVRTEVVLEVTLRGRRMRITRIACLGAPEAARHGHHRSSRPTCCWRSATATAGHCCPPGSTRPVTCWGGCSG